MVGFSTLERGLEYQENQSGGGGLEYRGEGGWSTRERGVGVPGRVGLEYLQGNGIPSLTAFASSSELYAHVALHSVFL